MSLRTGQGHVVASNAQWPLGIVSGQRLDVELSDFTLPVIQTDEKLNPLLSFASE